MPNGGDAARKTNLNGIEVESYLAESVELEPLALEEEFIRMPADLAYWNERHAAALRRSLIAKMERERVEAVLLCDAQFAEDLASELAKKAASMEQLKAAVKMAPEYLNARKAEIRTEVERVRLRGVVDAIAAKRDMLISLGAHVRLEMANDPALRKRMAESREARERD